ncbi:hypothetical protein E1091_17610, partial [Micromonospora fluostatini]
MSAGAETGREARAKARLSRRPSRLGQLGGRTETRRRRRRHPLGLLALAGSVTIPLTAPLVAGRGDVAGQPPHQQAGHDGTGEADNRT